MTQILLHSVTLWHGSPGRMASGRRMVYQVDSDDYSLYLQISPVSYGGRQDVKPMPERAAEILWNNVVAQAGIEYE
jgi:hypothetical protein